MKHVKRCLVAGFCVVVLGVASTQAAYTQFHWTGSFDSATWDNAGNWDNGTTWPKTGTASSGDNATIGNAGSARTILTPTSATTVYGLFLTQSSNAVSTLKLGGDFTEKLTRGSTTGLLTNTSSSAANLVLDLNGHKYNMATYGYLGGTAVTIKSSAPGGVLQGGCFIDLKDNMTFSDNVTVQVTSTTSTYGNYLGLWSSGSLLWITPSTTGTCSAYRLNSSATGPGLANLTIGDNTSSVVATFKGFKSQSPNYVRGNFIINTNSSGAADFLTFDSTATINIELWIGGNYYDYATDNSNYSAQWGTGKKGTLVFYTSDLSPAGARTVSVGRTGLNNDFRIGDNGTNVGNIKLARNLSTTGMVEIRDNSILNLDNNTLTCGYFNDNATSTGPTLCYTVGAGGTGVINVNGNLNLNQFTLNITDGGGLNPSGGTVTLFTYTGTLSGSQSMVLGTVPSNFRWSNSLIVSGGQVKVQYSVPQPQAATPIFNPGSSALAKPVYVTVTCATPGATIYYTTDNSTPSSSSTPIDNGSTILVSTNLTLKAVAYASNLDPSNIGVATYSFPYNRPMIIPMGTATIDGDLSDWAGATWAPLDKVYSGIPSDILEGYYTARWDPSGTKLYVAAKVRDNSTFLTDTFNTYNGQDCIELYVHTTGGPGTNYYTQQDTAQEYYVGVKQNPVPNNTAWTELGPGVPSIFIPDSSYFQAAGKKNGDWLYYEAEVTPFQYLGSYAGHPENNVVSILHVDDTVGLDVIAVGNSGGSPTGNKAENSMQSKYNNWGQFGQHRLDNSSVVQGTVTLQNFTGDVTQVPVTFTVRPVGSTTALETYTINLASDGSFAFTTGATGSYDITAKASHWLRQKQGSVNIFGATMVNFTLVNGDCDGDNEVTSTDLAIDLAAMDSSPASDARADLDGDGTVTPADLGILLANMDAVGAN